MLAGRFVAATRPVGIRSIGTFAIEVVGPGALKCTARKVVGVVVNHIENNANACLMQCLNHLFELANAHFGAIRIGAVRTLGHVIVQRIVTPIILRLIQTRFIYRGKVERRQNMHGINTQLAQVADGLFFG